jgi:cysteine desulfurase family protein
LIYLDNAATSWPKPELVYRTMDHFLREQGGNPGHGSHSLAVSALRTVEETRLLTARFIQAAEVERVIFTLNCTDSLNLALKGVLQAGDHIIISSLEHNAVMRPLHKLSGQGVALTVIPATAESGVTAVAAIAKAITPQTRMLVMVHASNVSGTLQPIADYGALARRHNLLFLVDAAQSAGHVPIDVVKDNIDLLAFSAHKGPLGPPGVGVLYCGPRVNPETLREGGTGSFSESDQQPEKLPSKYESGTLNSLGIAGLGAALKFINTTGFEKIRRHEQLLIEELLEGLKKIPGISIHGYNGAVQHTPLISCNIRGYTPGEAGAILDQAFDIKVRTGLHCNPRAHQSGGTYPLGTIRLSPGFFNTEPEITATLQAIRKIAESKNR